METNNKKITIGCVSPLTVIIFLAFFFAKIYDKIDWSWWWVFSPLWIPAAIILFILLILGLIYLSALIISLWK
jgi:hypothetical protein